MRQADALRRRSANEIDWDNVAEEIESVGNSEANELESRYEILLAHLLKWQHQPTGRGASWQITINEQRRRIVRWLEKTPGLKSRRDKLFGEAYAGARAAAAIETGIDLAIFPDTNPFTLAQVMDDSFWPEA